MRIGHLADGPLGAGAVTKEGYCRYIAMRKTLIAALVLMVAQFTQAETLTQNGNVVSACGFSDTSPGSLTAAGTSVTTAANASTVVLNNDPAVYDLVVGTPSVSTPSSFTGAGGTVSAVDVDIAMASGSVNPSLFSGTANANSFETLASDGSDVLTSGIYATLSRVATAGDYVGTVEVTCIAGEGEGF